MAKKNNLIIEIDGDSKKLEKALSKAGSAAKTAGKVIGAGFVAAGAAVGAIGTQAVKAYADFEQLVGGVDTLFKDSSAKVQKYADDAYMAAGLSANQYMDTITSFSASLLQSLGNDTEKAAEYGNQAVIDMSDNANKMGTDMQSIQNAYQGFAKQNYTMLDNLKLGYGGTKEEMQRLLQDAEKLSGIKYDISSFADITQAIHVIQTEMGITGTTAEEAATTIQGSLGMVKASWENLMVGLADPNADFDKLMSQFSDSISTFASNLMPVIASVLNNLPNVIQTVGTELINQLPNVLNNLLPQIADSASRLVTALSSSLSDNAPMLGSTATDILITLADTILQNIPTFIQVGINILKAIIGGMNEQLPGITSIIEAIGIIFAGIKIGTTIQSIVAGFQSAQLSLALFSASTQGANLAEATLNGTLTLTETIVGLLTGKIKLAEVAQLAMAKAQTVLNAVMSANPIALVVVAIAGLVTAFVVLWNKSEAFRNFWTGLWDGIKKAVSAAIDFVKNNWKDIILFITNPIAGAIKLLYNLNPKFRAWVDNLISQVKAWFGNMVSVGKNIVEGLWKGIINAKDWLLNKIKSFAHTITQGIKDFFGIHSPSKVMRDEVGKMIALGIAEGIEDNRTEVEKVLDELNQNLLDSEILYNKESERLKNSKNESDKKYLEKLQDTAETERKIYDARQKDIKSAQKEIVDQYKKMAEEVFDTIEEVEKAQESMAKKLKGYGALYTKKDREIGIEYTFDEKKGVLTGKKQFEEVYELNDLSKQTADLNKFSDNLTNLKEIKKMPKEFFNVMRDMGVDEGIKFTNALLELSDADFDSYIAQWTEKQSASEDISKILYRDEAEEAISAVTDKMSDFNAKFEENGEENAKSWGEGFIEKMKEIMPDITDRINAAFSSIVLTSGRMAAAGNTTYTANYYIQPSRGESTHQQIKAVNDAQSYNKMRGGY